MAIFALMLQAVKTFLNRSVVEDFSFKNQLWQSLQSGIYVFLFIYFFGGASFAGESNALMLAMFGAGYAVVGLTLLVWTLLLVFWNRSFAEKTNLIKSVVV